MSKQSKPVVSAVLPSYNYGHYICDAVESALAQTYEAIEVIVVDDGSTDDTKQRLSRYGDKIRYIYQSNGGLSNARNTGIQAAKGEYVAILDSDDMWHRDKIQQQMDYMQKQPDCGLVSCGVMYIDENDQLMKNVPGKSYENQKSFSDELFIRNCVGGGGSSALIRSECFGKAGNYDETLTSAEDWDLCLRINQHYPIHILEDVLVTMRMHSQSMSAAANAQRMLDNEIIVLDKQAEANITFQNKKSLRNKAYAYRYNRGAWAFWHNNDFAKARKNILKSLCLYPWMYGQGRQLGLLIRILVGIAVAKQMQGNERLAKG